MSKLLYEWTQYTTFPIDSVTAGVYAGVSLVASEAVTVSKLGRWKQTGQTGSFTVYLFIDGTATALRSVSIDITSSTAETFTYADITPITLSVGATYYLTSVTVLGENMAVGTCTAYNPPVSAIRTTSGDGAGVWADPAGETANEMFVGLDFEHDGTVTPPIPPTTPSPKAAGLIIGV